MYTLLNNNGQPAGSMPLHRPALNDATDMFRRAWDINDPDAAPHQWVPVGGKPECDLTPACAEMLEEMRLKSPEAAVLLVDDFGIVVNDYRKLVELGTALNRALNCWPDAPSWLTDLCDRLEVWK